MFLANKGLVWLCQRGSDAQSNTCHLKNNYTLDFGTIMSRLHPVKLLPFKRLTKESQIYWRMSYTKVHENKFKEEKKAKKGPEWKNTEMISNS